MGKMFWEIGPPGNFGCDITYVRPPAQAIGVEVRRQESLWGWECWAISLAGNRVATLHLATRVFWREIILVTSKRDMEPTKKVFFC